MSYCTEYCDMILEQLEPLSSDMKIVLAHESSIKDVPIYETIAAVGIKKCNISARFDASIDDNVKVDTGMRDFTVTVGINLYVPYVKGSRGCISVFDKIFDRLINANDEYEFCETKLLSTTYSRETQSLVTKTEFVFKRTFGYASGGFDSPEFIG